MDNQQSSTRGYGVASAVVWFIGISQGAVPLVVRPVFDREDRIALALLLPDPWWWIACIAVLLLAAAALLAIETAKERTAPTSPPPQAGDERDGPAESAAGESAAGFDALSGIVLLVGIYNGLAPFVSRLVFDGDLFLAFPLRLPSPWWWLTSLAVVVLTVALLEWIDRAKQRSTGAEGR